MVVVTETTLPASYCPIFRFPFMEKLLRKCPHQLSLLPYLLFTPQPIPAWLPPPPPTEMAFVKSLAPSLLPSLLNTFLSSPPSTSRKYSTHLAAAPFWKGSILSTSLRVHPWFPSYLSGCFFSISSLVPLSSPISKVSQSSVWV